MTEYTVRIDDKMKSTLDKLKHALNTNGAQVFRIAIALLSIAVECKKKNNKLAIVDEEQEILKEIVF